MTFTGTFAWALAAALAAVGGPALAQDSTSRPVVQPVPPPALNDLNAALKDLAHDPANVPALLRAGWASLGLDDTQAALGFFRRVTGLQPQNGEAKAGLASASLRQGDPVTAVRLFAEAEASGAPMARYAGDRGLALDLVGNNAAAQQFYRQALAGQADPEIVRRLALSQAISGDQRASDATLLPLLQHRDLAAYRTRAFALAILGKGEEAVSIAQTMLPAQISGRMAPYLRYMPRLTRAQQAAAANLGQFPPASAIGRDDPQIAAFSGAAAAPQVASAAPDARLIPTGQPLGRSDRKAKSARGEEVQGAKPRAKPGKHGTINVTYAPLPQASPPAAAPLPPKPTPKPTPVQQPAPPPAAESKPVLVASIDPPASSAPPAPPIELAPRPAIVAATALPAPKKDLSLAEAFADFANPAAPTRPAAGAVDVLKITPVRAASRADQAKAEAAKAKAKAKAKPKPPADPSRVWVQIGTGRSLKALAFTWRRLGKEGGALLARHQAYSAKWGATRRLVTGPYKSEDDAEDAIKALKKKGIDAFEFTSDEGEQVTPLG